MELDLRSLRHALALANERTVARAATRVGLSQPAMTRSIQALEARLGFQLFVRARGGVELTDPGRLFLESAARVVAGSEDLTRRAAVLQGLDVQAMTVGFGPYAAELLAGPSVARTLRSRRELRVRILVESFQSLAQAIEKRECDVAVAERSLVDEEFYEIRGFPRAHQGFFVVRTGHPLLAVRRPHLAEVLAYPITLMQRLPSRVLRALTATLPRRMRSELGEKAFPAVECSSLSIAREAVARSDVVGIFGLTMVKDELERGEVGVVDCIEPWLTTNFAATWPKRRALPPAVNDFVQALFEVDAQVHAAEEALARTFLVRGRAGSRERRRP